MLENRWVRYLVYGTSAVLLSEVMYHSYLYVRDVFKRRWSSRASSVEIAEVIWTNELTQSCTERHHSSPSVTAVPVESGRHVVQQHLLSSATPTISCPNCYCAVNNIGRLIALIDSAKYTIDLAIYTFTSYEPSLALQRALQRGVVVRIISDREMVYSSGSQISGLSKSGIPVRCPNSTLLMHHKFCILDGPQRVGVVLSRNRKSHSSKDAQGIVLSGSLNWTMQGFSGNWENIIISSNKILVNKFETEFERMWKAFHNEAQKLN